MRRRDSGEYTQYSTIYVKDLSQLLSVTAIAAAIAAATARVIDCAVRMLSVIFT